MPSEEATVNLFAVHEERMLARGARRLPVPVILVCGGLGSGKTTLLNSLLRNRLNLRLTCLVNDVAKLNVDAELLLSRDAAEKTVKLSNGCICHSLAGTLEDEMWSVLQECDGSDRVDYVVIETSGVAEPTSIVRSLERRHGRMTRARLDMVVLMVDVDLLAHELIVQPQPQQGREGEPPPPAAMGAQGAQEEQGAQGAQEAQRRLLGCSGGGEGLWPQLQEAGILLLTKSDLLDQAYGDRGAAMLREAVATIEAAAPWVEVVLCSHGDIPVPKLLRVEYTPSRAAVGVGGHEARLVRDAGTYATAEGKPSRPSHAAGGGSSVGSQSQHAAGTVPEWAAGWAKPMAAGESASGGPPTFHGFSSFEFRSESPLRLSQFQDLIAAGGAPLSPLAFDCAPAVADGVEPRDGSEIGRDHPEVGRDSGESGVRPDYAGLLRRVHRAKGVVWFAQDRRSRYIFQMSGRQRVQLAYDGEWQSRPCVELVLIGRDWEAEARLLHAALQGMAAPAGAATLADAAAGGGARAISPTRDRELWREAKAAREMLEADARFEVCAPVSSGDGDGGGGGDVSDGDGTVSSVVHWQLVGASLYGMSRTQLVRTHAIDIDAMNLHYAEALNASLANAHGSGWRAKPCVTTVPLRRTDDGAAPDVTVRFAVGGACRLEHVWPLLCEVADQVLARTFARLKLCRCDL